MTSTAEHMTDETGPQKAQGKQGARRTSQPSPAEPNPAACADEPQSEKTQAKSPPARKRVSPLATYRARMRFVGQLLNTAVEALSKKEDGVDAVGSGAYLCLMGEVFEALDGLSQALSLEDLAKLSKIVAEQRRAELSARKLASIAEGEAAEPTEQAGAKEDFARRKLPPHFGDIVQQIYGTGLADDVSPNECASRSADDDEEASAGEHVGTCGTLAGVREGSGAGL